MFSGEQKTLPGRWIKQSSSKANVVFLHGILSNADDCWKSASAYWPDMLARDSIAKDLGVYVISYLADAFSNGYQLGDAVQEAYVYLKTDGLFENGSTVVFICHSMGGIVARRMLVAREAEFIENNIRFGLFLVASPSIGSEYANFLSTIAKAIGNYQADILRFSQNNAWLSDLDRDFINLLAHKRLSIFGQELIEHEFIVFPKFFIGKQIVKRFAAGKYFGESVMIPNSNHFTIAKPEGPGAIQHKLLIDFLRPLALQLHQKSMESPGFMLKPSESLEDATRTSRPSQLSPGIEAMNEVDYAQGVQLLYSLADVFSGYSSQPPSKSYEDYESAEASVKGWVYANKVNADPKVTEMMEKFAIKIRNFVSFGNELSELLGGDGRPDDKTLAGWDHELNELMNQFVRKIRSLR
jgi:alpha/beta hydrolase family protein